MRRILGYEMTLAEWLGTALLLWAPYCAIGVLVTVLKPDHVSAVSGLAKFAALVGSVLFWPVLLVAGVCLP